MAKAKKPNKPQIWQPEEEEPDLYYDAIPNLDEVFHDENELKKKLQAAERKLVKFREEQEKDLYSVMKKHEAELKVNETAFQNMCNHYEVELERLREQIRELFEKNHEIHETAKLFVKGLEHLSRDGITVTATHEWKRNGNKTLADRVHELTGPGSRTEIVSIVPTITNPRGETVCALIITKHFERFRTEIKRG